MTGARKPQVALLSPCGWGNLGDAAIQEAAIAGVRRHLGEDASLVALTQNPSDTTARHGIPAYRIAGLEVENYALGTNPTSLHDAKTVAQLEVHRASEPASATPAVVASSPQRAPHRSLKSRLLGRQSPLGRLIRGAVALPRRVIAEVSHWIFALRLMSSTRLLMVSGGGQLDEFWGGPWGHPYAMFKWTFAARLTGARVVFLSVGAGTLANSTTRGLVRKAIRAAFYRSFRDPRTVKTVESLEVGGALNLVPDLAFSHPAGRAPEPARPSGSSRVIALSPIVYKDPASWPEKDAAFYSAYLDELVTLAQLLLERGDSVRVLTSDHSDNSAARELFKRLSERTSSGPRAQLVLPQTTEEFLSQMKECDLLVASRLHGVILAQIVATPVVAISYNWKVDEQMRQSDCPHYNAQIEKFDAPQVLGLIDAALSERDALSARLAARAAESYARLDRQYTEVFAFLDPAR